MTPAADACALLLLVAFAQAPAPPPDDAPSQELLLHLAEFGDADDRYVDPLELERASEADAQRARANDETEPNDDDRDPDEPPR